MPESLSMQNKSAISTNTTILDSNKWPSLTFSGRISVALRWLGLMTILSRQRTQAARVRMTVLMYWNLNNAEKKRLRW